MWLLRSRPPPPSPPPPPRFVLCSRTWTPPPPPPPCRLSPCVMLIPLNHPPLPVSVLPESSSFLTALSFFPPPCLPSLVPPPLSPLVLALTPSVLLRLTTRLPLSPLSRTPPADPPTPTPPPITALRHPARHPTPHPPPPAPPRPAPLPQLAPFALLTEKVLAHSPFLPPPLHLYFFPTTPHIPAPPAPLPPSFNSPDHPSRLTPPPLPLFPRRPHVSATNHPRARFRSGCSLELFGAGDLTSRRRTYWDQPARGRAAACVRKRASAGSIAPRAPPPRSRLRYSAEHRRRSLSAGAGAVASFLKSRPAYC